MRIIASIATSLDAKFTPPDVHKHLKMTSDADIEHLKALRDSADAILCGSGSVRAFPRVRYGHDRSRRPIQCVVSRHLNLDFNSPLFVQEECPTLVFVDTRCVIPKRIGNAEIIYCNLTEPMSVVDTIKSKLKLAKVSTLLVEGGGYIIGLFLRAKAINEMYITYLPSFFGDIGTPGMLQGISYSLNGAPRLCDLNITKLDHEFIVHGRVEYGEK